MYVYIYIYVCTYMILYTINPSFGVVHMDPENPDIISSARLPKMSRPGAERWLVLSREWMGMGVAGIIINHHGSFPHSLLSSCKFFMIFPE